MENRRITSKKRQAMYDLLCADSEHPSAETLFTRLKPDYPELSLGTVYRNLSVLEDEGLIFSVGKVDGQERYDARLDAHAHFVCKRCRSVSDIELDGSTRKLINDLVESFDCKAQSFTVTLSGICGKCRKAEED